MTDLSRRVAEKMGWEYTPPNSWTPELGRRENELWSGPNGERWSCYPPYATDLNLAMEFAAHVCEKLGDNVNFTIWHDRRTGDTCVSFWESGEGYIDFGSEHVQGLIPKDLASAIDRAGLRALGEE